MSGARDQDGLDRLRSTLAVDGYHLVVDDLPDDRARVTVSADPATCADCLVPKDVMRAVLAPLLGLDAAAVDLTYPADAAVEHP